MKKKMGRPRLSEKSAKNVLLGIRFDQSETDLIEKAASQTGESKSEWGRKFLLWAAQRENVRSAKWKAKDLNGKSVKFSMMVGPSSSIQGNGQFLAMERGDGSIDLRIITRGRLESDPLAFSDVPVSQRGLDLLRKASAGEKHDFVLNDPLVP